MVGSFWELLFLEEWQRSVADLHVLKEVMREQVGTIFPSANGLDDVESLKCLSILVFSPILKNRNLRPPLPLNYADFHES